MMTLALLQEAGLQGNALLHHSAWSLEQCEWMFSFLNKATPHDVVGGKEISMPLCRILSLLFGSSSCTVPCLSVPSLLAFRWCRRQSTHSKHHRQSTMTRPCNMFRAMTIIKCYVFHLFPFRHWAAGLQLCGGCHQTVHVLPCVYVCASERSLGALSLSPGSLIRCVKAPLNDGLLCQCGLRRINLFHWFLFRQNASVCCFPPPSRRLPAIIDGNGLRQINPFLVKIAANNPWLCLTSVNQREARFWQPHSQRALTPGESSRSTWTKP